MSEHALTKEIRVSQQIRLQELLMEAEVCCLEKKGTMEH